MGHFSKLIYAIHCISFSYNEEDNPGELFKKVIVYLPQQICKGSMNVYLKVCSHTKYANHKRLE